MGAASPVRGGPAAASRGGSLRGIARATGLRYRTVERYVRSESCPDWRPGRRGPSRLDRFAESISRRLREGCRNTLQVRRELLEIGYRGAVSTVRPYVRRLEGQANGPSPQPAATDAVARAADPSSRRLVALTMVRPDDRPAEDQRTLDALRAGDETIREAIELVEGFAAVIRGRDPGDLTDWLIRADGGSVADLRTFARGLRRNEAAVRAGVELPWSNGPVEGHVNLLKAIKRLMNG